MSTQGLVAIAAALALTPVLAHAGKKAESKAAARDAKVEKAEAKPAEAKAPEDKPATAEKGAGPAGEQAGAVKGDPPVLSPGDAAPQFGPVKLHNPDEAGMQLFNLRRYVGEEPDLPAKGVLISFFATWCGPCKKELPFLVQLHEKYKDRGLQVVSISIDKDEPAFKLVKEMVAANRITFPVVMDRYNLLARRYLGEKTAMPSVFLVRRDGTVALVKQGYDGDASAFLTAEVEKLIGG